MAWMDVSLMPVPDREMKEALRGFLGLAFRDLMTYRDRISPESVRREVWFDFALVDTTWQRQGYQLDT